MPRFRNRHLFLLLVPVAATVLCVIGIAGYFRLSSETAALRTSLMQSVGGQWNKTIAVHIGGLTSALLRTGLRCVKLAPEPRAAIEALHGAEAGIYRLQPGSQPMDRDAVLSAADAAMAARGWERAVGVVKEEQVVAVYLPRKGVTAEKMKCCFMVLAEGTLVVGSARVNLAPLMAIAKTRMEVRQSRAAPLACPFFRRQLSRAARPACPLFRRHLTGWAGETPCPALRFARGGNESDKKIPAMTV